MSVNLIWAQARDIHGRIGAIGYKNTIPWGLFEDARHFRDCTYGGTIIMGHKTWDSLPKKPLPGRKNVVLSRRKLELDGATSYTSLEAALEAEQGDVWIIGGSKLFERAMPLADMLYVTQIDAVVKADTFAPKINPIAWELIDGGKWMVGDATIDGEAKSVKYRFTKYERK